MNLIALQSVTALLTTATGIAPHSLDPKHLHNLITNRAAQLNLPKDENTPLAYADYLDRTPAELDHLIDLIIVPETRFFRDPAVFDHLRLTLPHLARTFPGTLRILSAPCSSGQETYSLAAILHDLDIPHHIDAFDISLTALAAARSALYPTSTLRNLTPSHQSLLGTLTESIPTENPGLTIHPHLRSNITFQRRNLAAPSSLDPSLYHLILCRNLFIYLHPAARTNLAQSLAQSLLLGGQLILGSADRVEELSTLFTPQRPAASFAFTHRTNWQLETGNRKLSANPSPPPRQTPQDIRVAQGFSLGSSGSHSPHRDEGALAPTALELYARALQHQQRGNLRSAERRCRQALYLDPNNLPALELLQSLWHQQPNQRLRHALTDRILRTRLLHSQETAQ